MRDMESYLIALHKKLLVMPNAALAILAASAGSLATAYIAQYVFDIAPCILCYYQRVPYALAIVFSLLALAVRKNDKRARMFLGLCAFGFFVNACIAFFHSGVELQWWAGTDECGVNPDVLKGATDIAAMRESLLATPTVRCDQINFTVLGFTMANWNVVACLGLALFSLLAAMGPCVNWAKCDCCKKCD